MNYLTLKNIIFNKKKLINQIIILYYYQNIIIIYLIYNILKKNCRDLSSTSLNHVDARGLVQVGVNVTASREKHRLSQSVHGVQQADRPSGPFILNTNVGT